MTTVGTKISRKEIVFRILERSIGMELDSERKYTQQYAFGAKQVCEAANRIEFHLPVDNRLTDCQLS